MLEQCRTLIFTASVVAIGHQRKSIHPDVLNIVQVVWNGVDAS